MVDDNQVGAAAPASQDPPDRVFFREPAESRVRVSSVRAGFADFYAVERPQLVRFLMKHGADVHEADEAAQAAFTIAFPRWDEIEWPRAYLRKVALREYYRLTPRGEAGSDGEDGADQRPRGGVALSAAAAFELTEQERAVLAALAALPLKQRQVMAWRYDGFTIAEIASVMGISAEAVRQNLHKARMNLKKHLRIRPGGGNGRNRSS